MSNDDLTVNPSAHNHKSPFPLTTSNERALFSRIFDLSEKRANFVDDVPVSEKILGSVAEEMSSMADQDIFNVDQAIVKVGNSLISDNMDIIKSDLALINGNLSVIKNSLNLITSEISVKAD
ncbi:MAG: hypothetical protein LBT86_08775 [Deltaproteobacteria bacterium]|jgi:hypothetical protein|nr:hypothetical protein [Deltaproteobacteria bacterium]